MPTLWFWNDPENQRLLAPVVILVTPHWVLLNAIQMWLRLGAWVSIAGGLAICVLTQGLVERYIRSQLRLRVRSVAGFPVAPFLLLAGTGAVAAIVVSASAWGAAQALFTALVLALVMGVTAAATMTSTRATTLLYAALAAFCGSLAAFAAFGLPGLGATLGVLLLGVPLAVTIQRQRNSGVGEDAASLPPFPERAGDRRLVGSSEACSPEPGDDSRGEERLPPTTP
ncbi:hypothetical protein [Nannocystis pusilla]|uniref:hypothetical protein n=1 Tax=Nannocystis pusilla TaxID=889268 RepID=UPI003BF0F299